MRVTPGRSVRTARWLARAPRLVLIATCVCLSAAGLRSLAEPSARATIVRAAPAASAPEVEALAESYAREYLTWNGTDRADRLARYSADVEVPDAPSAVHQAVRWTSVVNSEQRADAHLVTVAASTTRGTYHLAIRVRRLANGLLTIGQPPALVGGVPVDLRSRPTPELEIEDRPLVAVLRRALSNYLEGDRADLLADLHRDALVVLPDHRLRVRRLGSPTWVERGTRAAIDARVATPSGVQLALRYELAVVLRAGRWLVQSIHTNPTKR